MPMDPRTEELLVERALRGLDDDEHRELQQRGAEDDDSYDLAAAAILLATTPVEAMPAELANKVLAAAPAGPPSTLVGVVAPTIGKPAPVASLQDQREKQTKRRSSLVPWLAAAACLLVAIGAWLWAGRDGKHTSALPIAEARAELLRSAPDVTTIEWKATDDPAAKGALGDVVWSQTRQLGYMRFRGLAVNDPKQYQYQLWIFDKGRDDKYPVDGGVFDITPSGEVIVPIKAKLAVDEAAMFAVTVERPGGVVVSKRERIVVIAARKS